jgi:hypothetical protein
MCPDCWREATLRHAGGRGEGESVSEVYSRLIDEYWCRTERGRLVVEARKKEDEDRDA